MGIVPFFLFPLFLILSFFTRKNRKVFLFVLTMGTLTFLMSIELLSDSVLTLLSSHPAYTYSALAGGFAVMYFLGYGLLWLFMPINYIHRIFPLLYFLAFSLLSHSPIVFLKITSVFGVISLICFYIVDCRNIPCKLKLKKQLQKRNSRKKS